MATVYLIHLDRPLAHARHYMGQSDSVEDRLRQHRDGHGAALLREARRRGIRWRVVRYWRGVGRDFERRLKARYHNKELCPLCSGLSAHKKSVSRRG